MNKLKILFFAVILQSSFLYADVNLQEYVESVSYEKGDLLCYSTAYPLYLHVQSGNFSPTPITSRHHIFWRDAKYRRAMLEWMLLPKDAFSMSLGSRTDESLLNLYTQYPTYLINAEGFNQAIEHCATKYNMDEESLKNGIKEMILFTNDFASVMAKNVVFEIPMSIVGGALLFRALRGTWRAIKWLYKMTGKGYRRLRGITPVQASILQRQRQQAESMRRGFFQFTRGEIGLELGFMLYINYQFNKEVDAHYEDVQNEVFEQEIRDRPSTRVSPLPEVLYHYRVDENIHTRLETWWKARIEDYRFLLIQRGLNVQSLLETDPQSLDFYNAFSEYQVWVDMYLMDYWLVKGIVDWFNEQIAQNQIIQADHQRSYEILKTTLQILDLRKRQLERRMQQLQDGQILNAAYELEHLKAIFTILDQSRDTRSSPYLSNYLPYGYCLSLEDYKKFVSFDISEEDIFETQEWQLCQFHLLQTYRRLGYLNTGEWQEFRRLLQTVRQL